MWTLFCICWAQRSRSWQQRQVAALPLLTCLGFFQQRFEVWGKDVYQIQMYSFGNCNRDEVDLILEGGSSTLFFLPEWTNTQIKKTKKGGHLFKEKAENLRLKVPLKAFWQAGDYCVNDMKSVVLKTGESKWKTVKTKSKTVGKSGTRSRTLNSPAGYQFHETENVWMSAEKYQRRWMKSHQRYEQSYLYISFWSNLTNGYPLYHFTWLVG